MNTIRIETLGCRLNQIESESAARIFLDSGFQVIMTPVTAETPSDSETLLCIINTCTVTQKAEQKARRIIRLLLSKYENAVILVTGCYAQLRAEEIRKIDKRIFVLGGQIKSRLSNVPSLLKSAIPSWNAMDFLKKLNDELLADSSIQAGIPEDSFKLSTSAFLNHSRASLKIQDGCNNNCAFCAIHLARGRSVSIDVETAVNRVKEIEKSGNGEIVLTTVNIAQYRSEYKGQVYNFTKLLKLLLENTSKVKFRISSLYPEIIDDEFCEVIKNPRVQPHFHISVQSGSDKILKLMNRHYYSDSVRKACRLLKEVKAKPFLACDIITGYPGETDEDFEQTMKLIKDCDFTWVHAFPFSERPGTAAIKLPSKVPQSISGERVKKINKLAVKNKIAYLSDFLGVTLDAIIETSRKPVILNDMNNKIVYHAVTDNFIHCEIITHEVITGSTCIKVKITEILTDRIMKGGEIEVRGELIK